MTQETDLALEAGAMARSLVTTMIERIGNAEQPWPLTASIEVEQRLASDDGYWFGYHLVLALGMAVTSAVGVAASALVEEDDWRAAVAGKGQHPEFHDRVMEIWSAICANWVQGEIAAY